MRSALLTTALALVLHPAIASAQWHAGLRPEDRIEITWPRSTVRFAGSFLAGNADSVWLRDEVRRDTIAFALSPAPRIRVHRGKRTAVFSRAGKGFLIGFGVGASLGLVAGLADPEGAEFVGGAAGAGAFTGLLLAAPGLLIGALTGISVDKWELVPLSQPGAEGGKPRAEGH